jgi:hypothetical protein
MAKRIKFFRNMKGNSNSYSNINIHLSFHHLLEYKVQDYFSSSKTMLCRLVSLFALTVVCVSAAGSVWCTGPDGKAWYQTTKDCCNADHGVGTGHFNEWNKECVNLDLEYISKVANCCRSNGAIAQVR